MLVRITATPLAPEVSAQPRVVQLLTALGGLGLTGPVAWSMLEPWDNTIEYVAGPPASVVSYGGSTFVALVDNMGVIPGSDPSTWALIAAKGDSAGVTASFTSETAVSALRALSQRTDGRVGYGSVDDLTTAETCVGISLQAANAPNVVIQVQEADVVSDPSWTWTPDAPIFLGLNGALVQTPPAGLFQLQLGAAINATSIRLRIAAPAYTP